MAFRKCKRCGQVHSKLGIEISGDVLKRTARSSTHLLKMLDAWAFSADVIDKHPEVNTIAVYDQDAGGKVYRVSRAKFLEYATRAKFSPFYPVQLALPRSSWDSDRPPAHMFEAEPVQTDFFAEAGRPMQSYTVTRTRWGRAVPKWMIEDANRK